MRTAEQVSRELIRTRMALQHVQQMNAIGATEDEHVRRALETMKLMATITALEQEAKDIVQKMAQSIYNDNNAVKDPEPAEEPPLPMNYTKKKSN